MGRNPQYSEEDCIEALKEAADRLGHSPSRTEYLELGMRPSQRTIRERLGGWNEAKSAAGLEHVPRGRGTRVSIDEDYFAEIDDPEKAYWLGTLFAHSSRSGPDEKSLTLSHTEKNGYYVDRLMEAVGSEYAIRRFTPSHNGQDRVQTAVSNPTFINHLIDHGLDQSARLVDTFPDLDSDVVVHFYRGFLELKGNLSTSGSGGWSVKSNSKAQLEHLGQWGERHGVKRWSIGGKTNGFRLQVSNPFDAATFYEAFWPENVATQPANPELARELARRVAENHHYPENLSYTDDEGAVVEPGESGPVDGGDKEKSMTDEDDANDSSDDGEMEPDHVTPNTIDETATDAECIERQIDIDPIVLSAVASESVFDSDEARAAAERAVRDLLVDKLHRLVKEGYPPVHTGSESSSTVEVSVRISTPASSMLDAVVSDPESPFGTPGQIVSQGAREAELVQSDTTRTVSLSPVSALFLQVASENATPSQSEEVSKQVERLLRDVLAEELT